MIPMQSDSIKNVTRAMMLANEAIDEIVKESEGHNYKYAKLPQLLKTVNPKLKQQGLMLKNVPQLIDGIFVLVCQITHCDSGEYIRGCYPIEPDGRSGQSLSQQKGAAITYAARYSISNMLSIPVLNEEDNDAALPSAEEAPSSYSERKPSTASSHAKKVWSMIYKEKDEVQRKTLINDLCKNIGNNKINEFTVEQCKEAELLLDGYFNG